MQKAVNLAIFQQASSCRLKIIQLLPRSLDNVSNLIENFQKANAGLEEVVSELHTGDIEDQYRAYQIATTIYLLLIQWKQALRNAEVDGQRYLISAKLQASEVDISKFAHNQNLIDFLKLIKGLAFPNDLEQVKNHMLNWDLPILLYANTLGENVIQTRSPRISDINESEDVSATVAFLKFEINGIPAEQYEHLNPGTSYDLTIEVRVSKWPTEANNLSLAPVTIDKREREWLPRFEFSRPEGNPPFTFKSTGRAVLEIANSFGSRPYEFLYTAEFDDHESNNDIMVIGHRKLLLEGVDVSSNPITGFSNVDRHLLKIRNQIRTVHGLPDHDINNTMTILSGLGNIAAQALKTAMFKANTSEKDFQNKVAELLRNKSNIGENLDSHSEASGGITDLVFEGIPIELKVENSKILFPKDFTKYFNQTAAYSIGLGKKIGILCVLESTVKINPIGNIENDIEIFNYPVGSSNILIIVVVIRGGFPIPSYYSK